MKGTCFQRPLEYNLLVDGESWTQGQEVTGTLTVRNHGAEAASLAGVSVRLARGGLKKVHAKTAGALDVAATVAFDASAKLDPQGTASLPWTFPIGLNDAITDKTASPFLVYGRGEPDEQAGRLQLTVLPHPLIREFIDTIRIQFRFVEKAVKFVKAGVEAKLDPPDSQAFAKLDYLTVGFAFDGEALELNYKFNVKQLEATAAAIDMKKAKKGLTQRFEPAQYRTSTGRFNHERVEAAIREALASL